MKRIGLFGGSFNPIHNGHIALAKAALKECGLDEVWLMVSPQNPLKRDMKLLDDALRLEMAQKALEGVEGVKVCDYEMHLPKPSYTWHTLQALAKDYPDYRFTLLIGGDNWAYFQRWYHWEDIQRTCDIAVYPREGYAGTFDAPLINVSSTEIRSRVEQGESVADLVPTQIIPLVENYYQKKMNRVFNTGETEEELRKTYNPEGSCLRKAQLRMLDMLVYLFETANKAGVSCRLDGGNVLGAMRHGGFIPWDDDIDVVVSRHDFKILCRYMEEHPHPQYVLQTHQTDKGSFVPWGRLRDLKSEYVNPYPADSREGKAFEAQKFRGLQIDIFPYEGYMIPSLQRLAAKMACVVHFDLSKSHPVLANLTYTVLHRVVYPCFRLIGHCFGNPNLYMHSYGTWFYFQFPKDVLLPHRELVFEGYTVLGPADADRFCRIVYGDYMNLPPKEKRAVHASEIIVHD